MQVKIKVKIDNDIPLRDSLSPYHLYKSDVQKSIANALDDALDAINYRDVTEYTAPVKHYHESVGTLKITVK